MRPHSSAAFSLLEMLCALALFFILVGSVLNFSIAAARSTQAAVHKRAATLVAQRIAETLKATLLSTSEGSVGIVATAPDWISNPTHSMRIDLTSSSVHELTYIAYSDSGEPYREVSAGEYEHPFKEKDISSLAAIIIKQDPLPGLVDVFIRVSSPASLPEKKRHQNEFSFYLSTMH